jgi:UDP-glucose 4-epimerase
MRALVTGGAGFIGSGIVRACLEAGEAVRVLDDFSTGVRRNLDEVRDDIELLEGSFVDLDTAARAVADCEVVYHQGALPSVVRSVEDPVETHRVNALGTLHILEASRQAGVRRVVYAASSSAYGDTEVLPKREDMPANPLSPYALQKLAGEHYCALYTRLFGLEAVALRYFNVFGPRQNPDSDYAAVIPLFGRAALAGKPARIDGDGGQTRDFTYIDDVVAANRAAAAGPPESAGLVFNVARGGRTSILDLWYRICDAAGVERIEPEHGDPRPGDVRDSQADVSRARDLLGWSAQVSLEDGLSETVRGLEAGAA